MPFFTQMHIHGKNGDVYWEKIPGDIGLITEKIMGNQSLQGNHSHFGP